MAPVGCTCPIGVGGAGEGGRYSRRLVMSSIIPYEYWWVAPGT